MKPYSEAGEEKPGAGRPAEGGPLPPHLIVTVPGPRGAIRLREVLAAPGRDSGSARLRVQRIEARSGAVHRVVLGEPGARWRVGPSLWRGVRRLLGTIRGLFRPLTTARSATGRRRFRRTAALREKALQQLARLFPKHAA